MPAARSILFLLLVAALLAGGCGGSERAGYERDLAKIGRTVDRSLEQLPQDDSETIGPEDVARLAGDLREAANQLDDLDPPESVAPAQQQLERGMRHVADSFDALADDLRAARTDEAKAELFVEFATDEKIQAAFDDITGAQETYAAKGYRVFGTTAPAKG